MAEVFLSYSPNDRDAAQSVARAIERSDLSVFDSTQTKPGASWQDEVRTKVEVARCVLVLWSKAAAQSPWAEHAIRLAIRAWSEDRLLLARLDDAELPAGLRDLGVHDLRYGLAGIDLEALVERARRISQTAEATLSRVRGAPHAPRPSYAQAARAQSAAAVAARRWRVPSYVRVSVRQRTVRVSSMIAAVVLLFVSAGYLAWDFFGGDDRVGSTLSEILDPDRLAAVASGASRRSEAQSEPTIITEENALALVRPAAEQGNAGAQSSLAWMYATGTGVPQNDTEAVKWFRKAAEQGDAEAVKWLRKAAEQGNAEAQENLAAMYADGQRVQVPSHNTEPFPSIAYVVAFVGALVLIVLTVRRFVLSRRDSRMPATNASETKSPADQVSAEARFQVFVSYSRLDGGTVDRLVHEIEKAGCLVWIDRRPLSGIQRYAAPIVGAIKSSQVVALMCSRNAFQSDHVIREIYVAGDHKKPFLLFQLDPCEFPDEILYFVSGFPRVPLNSIQAGQVRSEIARLMMS